MRVCPKCGYVDPAEWRHLRWSYWIDYTEIKNFIKLMPILAEKLIKNPDDVVENKYYLYRLKKTKTHVERKAKIDYGRQWKIPMESGRHLRITADNAKVWKKWKVKKLIEAFG